MDTLHIQPSPDSAILAFGTTQSPKHRRAWYWGMAAFGMLAGLLTLLGWMINRPVEIPAHTAVLISVSPHSAKALPENLQETLPAPWRSALAGDARWPVALGAERTPEGWRAFAIMPTWYGTRRMIQEGAPATSTRPFRYLDAWRWSLWMDPRFVFLNTTSAEFASAEFALEPFTAVWRDGALVTTLAFANNALPIGLVSLLDARYAMLDVLNIEPSAIALDGNQIAMTFRDPLTEDQAAVILGALGFHETRGKTLDDGIVVRESVALSSASGTLFGERVDRQGMTVDLEPQFLRLGGKSLAETRCGGAPLIQASATTVSSLLNSVDIATEKAVPAISFLSEKGRLTICFD